MTMDAEKAKVGEAKAKPVAEATPDAKAKPVAKAKPATKAKPAKGRAKKLASGKKSTPRLLAKAKAEKAKAVAAKLEKKKARKELKTLKIKKRAQRKLEKKEVPSGEPKKPSKKALAIAAKIHCRQIFIGNVPESAGEKELWEMLKSKNFQSAVRSIRLLKSSKGGKKATKDDKGKVIPRSRGAAFVRLKSKTARDEILKEKDWKIDGKTLRVELAGIKKKHTARLEAQTAEKQKKLALREESVKKLKVTMNENRLKNLKHKRNLHLKLRRATSKKGNKTAAEKRRIVNIREKLRTKKAKNTVRSLERKKLYGIKARKAMVRMSRK